MRKGKGKSFLFFLFFSVVDWLLGIYMAGSRGLTRKSGI